MTLLCPSALPSLARSAEEVLTSMWDGTRHEQFMEHAHLIGEKVKSIKSAIKRPTNPALGNTNSGINNLIILLQSSCAILDAEVISRVSHHTIGGSRA